MKTEIEKEIEHIMLKEKHCKKDAGGACLFTMEEGGILVHQIEDESLYLSDKKKLTKEHKK